MKHNVNHPNVKHTGRPVVDQVRLALLGTSWRTTLAGYGLAVLIGGLDYLTSASYINDPKVFWTGLAIAIGVAVKGRLTKDEAMTNSLDPGTIAKPVKRAVEDAREHKHKEAVARSIRR